ncbi:hypothetical protein EVAR_25353_1 [Eumeta japonica]|uniref:Uncharacterized protein n=1 Tax=Eumeta variegata TaxID=151549 RepID=A0A4C1Y0B3_EUMVA|nr:hypothetical protein EVAR_25353_1 [Eumeta japonica]
MDVESRQGVSTHARPPGVTWERARREGGKVKLGLKVRRSSPAGRPTRSGRFVHAGPSSATGGPRSVKCTTGGTNHVPLAQ